MESGYTIVDHTADIGIKVWGKTLQALFIETARDMVSLVVNREKVINTKQEYIYVEAESYEELIFLWLKEILFIMNHKRMVFKHFQIEMDHFSESNVNIYFIKGLLGGEPIDTKRHEICREIKAITRHDFYLKKKGPWWETNILFDV